MLVFIQASASKSSYLLSSSALLNPMVICCPILLQELPNGDPKDGPFWEDKGSLEGESSSRKCSQVSP